MRPYAWWPDWLLVCFRSVLEWSYLMPEMLLAIYVEMAARETFEDLGWFCPAASGVA